MVSRDSAKVLAFAALLISTPGIVVPTTEVKGECGAVFKGQVCTWARTQGGKLVEVGASVPMASIESAPADVAEMAWPPVAEAKLKLPASAQAKSGFTQLTVFWEAMGHAPAPFMTPHFDFHFYLVPVGEEMTYSCKDRTKPAALPAGYVLPDEPLPPDLAKMIGVDTLIGVCVPNMGMHAVPIADVTRKDAFVGDFVIGYYGGKPVFIEPMLPKARLMEKKSFDLAIPTIPGLKGNYPRVFHAVYDAKQAGYQFVFSGFAPGA
jgi:hypothetical protein